MQKRDPNLDKHLKLFLQAAVILALLSPVASADIALHRPTECSGQWENCGGAFFPGGAVATARNNQTGV